ncbi:GLPGLI family protein [Aquimarina sp. AD1]|uniref:GLPGLI family protein n=1 Tax=Aquimarina sp. (strain AD1) TaxID=1714848 RepID=UPI000E4E630B|nr:GLPGLI family protein [Aquimarina sp. AD1]AXT58002.1 GLPGLI family protein [Aquimarina sp. AD1]RKN33144.1 GLPGLI family protein [Aquimarina sp. AD1]
MKTICTWVTILVTSLTIAQDFQGKAYYFSKTGMDMDFGRRQMSEDQKKAIADRMKSVMEKTFVLTFNKSAATYKEEAQLDASGGGGGRWGAMLSGFTSNNYYKSIKDGQYYDQREFYGKNFLIKDSLAKYNWTLVNETKKIGNYTCFKATTTKKVNEVMDFRAMRRKAREQRDQRENGSDDQANADNAPDMPEPLEEIEVTAWYTPEIPVNQGPGSYWGLPGLILEVQEGRTTLLCNKIVLNAEEKEEIKPPTKGKDVSQAEFDEITKKKVEEMIEQFSTQRRGRGGLGGGRRN